MKFGKAYSEFIEKEAGRVFLCGFRTVEESS